jgi:serine O-acetyltransferase
MFKFGIQIGYEVEMGSGFYIGHFGTIIISSSAVVGNNCNISQGVTIGRTNQGERAGAPTIGDNVYIGPGAKVFGNIKIGDNVAIGANAVVTKDVDPGVVVAGVPARILSNKGSFGYINRTDYDTVLLKQGNKNNRLL